MYGAQHRLETTGQRLIGDQRKLELIALGMLFARMVNAFTRRSAAFLARIRAQHRVLLGRQHSAFAGIRG
ncbi:hypothetical protein [Bradyrhizobium sp. JR3.5]